MAHDVFISYSSNDKTIADAVVAGLEQKGVRCWVAPRDLTPGISWGQGIAEAIEKSRVMVVIISENANQSKQVAREVERAISKDVTVIPFRIENIDPTGAIAYFLSSEHWLDAITPPMESHINKLGNIVKVFLREDEEAEIEDSAKTQFQQEGIQKNAENQPFWAKIPKTRVILGILLVSVICLVGIVVVTSQILSKNKSKSADFPSNQNGTTEQLLQPTATDTPIVESTSMPNFTVSFESTSMPTSTPTLTLTSTNAVGGNLSVGWREHTSDEFSISLPESWEAVDINQEGMSALMELMSEYDPAWADLIGSTYENGNATPPLFWAMDTEKIETGYANVNLIKQTLPFAVPMSLLCSELESQYAQLGVNIFETDCSLEVNELPAARITLSMPFGSMSMQEYQFLFMNGSDFWALTFAVEEAGWSNYKTVFEEIAETFRILQ